MNITLLGHRDIASLYALDRIIGLLPEHKCTVILSATPALSEQVGSALAALTSYDESLSKRFLAGALGEPVAPQLSVATRITLNNPNASEGLRVLAEPRPDLMISIRYRHILREAAIAIPRLGVLNLHSGILPDYRGVMATFWAMLDKADEIGTTLHWIVDSGIDTGPVIEIRKRPTRPARSYLVNVVGLYAKGCDTIATAVRTIAAGSALPIQQQGSGGRYFSAPKAEDIQRFENQGMRLFSDDEAEYF